MVRNMPIARELGYLSYDDADVVEIRDIEKLPPERR
jgi:ribonuclease J